MPLAFLCWTSQGRGSFMFDLTDAMRNVMTVVPEARTISTVPEARTISTVPEARW